MQALVCFGQFQSCLPLVLEGAIYKVCLLSFGVWKIQLFPPFATMSFLINTFPGYKIIKDKVILLKSPLLVDSGNYVPVEIIQLKKNDSTFFEKILLFAPKNPNPLIVSFSMTKRVSTNIKTRIRLSDSQNIILAGINRKNIFFDFKKTELLTPGCDV